MSHLRTAVSSRFFTAFVCLGLFASIAGAQPVPRDSIAVEQRRVAAELSRGYYWHDRIADSGIENCQLTVHAICLAEHLTRYGTQPVLLAGGYPRVFENAVGRQPGVFVAIPDRLEEIADSAPDNGWAIGHLAYINAYSSTRQRAMAALAPCRPSEWWCTALRAFVNHSYDDYGAADSLFTIALGGMPVAERCRWRDISALLDSTARAIYSALSCDARNDFENRFWWLSDPLYSLAGNDRRSEHYSRRVIDSLFRNLPTPFHKPAKADTWGDAMSELLIRYGTAAHWIIPGKITGVGPWIHYHTPTYQFSPRGVSVAPGATPRVRATDFRLDIPLGSATERYHPSYDYVVDLTHSQVVALPRGDSMIVAAAIDLSREAFAEAAPFNATLFLMRNERSTPVTVRRQNVSARASFNTTIPNSNTLVGIEALSSALRVATRTRFTLEPPTRMNGLWITQPVLLSQFDTPPRRASDALPLMLPTEQVTPGQPVGVYWEVGGAPVGAVAQFNVRAILTEPRRSGIFSAITGLFRPVVASDTLVVSWSDRLAEGGISGHAVNLNLASLRAGSYRLELEVEFPGGLRATSSREMDVVTPGTRRRPLIEVLQQPVPRATSTAEKEVAPIVRRR